AVGGDPVDLVVAGVEAVGGVAGEGGRGRGPHERPPPPGEDLAGLAPRRPRSGPRSGPTRTPPAARRRPRGRGARRPGRPRASPPSRRWPGRPCGGRSG